jgi:hypothetical protein
MKSGIRYAPTACASVLKFSLAAVEVAAVEVVVVVEVVVEV